MTRGYADVWFTANAWLTPHAGAHITADVWLTPHAGPHTTGDAWLTPRAVHTRNPRAVTHPYARALRPLIDRAVLHNEDDVLDGSDVVRGVAGHSDQVRQHSLLHAP